MTTGNFVRDRDGTTGIITWGAPEWPPQTPRTRDHARARFLDTPYPLR